jgi:hypothetical protein
MLVTCYYNIYGRPDTDNYYLELFKDLGMSGIPITVFTDPSLVHLFSIFPPSVTVIGKSLNDFELYSIGMNYKGELPFNRSASKDTKEFLSLMNTKTEFVSKAAALNFTTHLKTDTFIWIDFGILKIVKNKEVFLQKLREINDRIFDKITIPGCWKFGMGHNINNVHWRFCGGLFVIPRIYIDIFNNHHKNVLIDFCTMPQYKLTWETNIWYIVELCSANDIIDWYSADHNDTILTGIDAILNR